MSTTRFTTPIKTRKASRVPGDPTLVLTAQATDRDGKVYPKGTRLVPLSGGYDNAAGGKYQDVTVVSQ